MKKLLISIVFTFCFFIINGQTIQSMEFQRQEISDILLALAESSNTSILPDETVTGKVSFYFSDSSLNDALDVFSETFNLFYEKDGNIIKVSKIKSSYDIENKKLSIKVHESSLQSIIKNISKKIGITILYDNLPQTSLSLDIENLSVAEVLQICLRKFPEYEVEANENFFYIKRIESNSNKRNINSKDILTKNNNLYTLKLDKGRSLELLTKLFNLEQQEYSLFTQSDVMLENLYFSEKDFETILRLILEHANADFIVKDGIYYIIDVQKKNVYGKLKETEIIQLLWLQASEVPSLIPSDLSNSANIKVDKNNNALLLTGTGDEIITLKRFISKIDVPLDGFTYKKVDVKYLDAKDIVSLIPARYQQNQPIVIPGSNSILVSGSVQNINMIENFINEIDEKKTGFPVRLKYIKTEALLKNLPPSINQDLLADSGYPNLVFYKGTEDNLKLFLHELEAIDKPQPQIKYQLLVIQYSKGSGTSITPSISAKPVSQINSENVASMTEGVIFNGELNNIMGLSFDVISKFGYQFAASLNTKIHENTANVFTDTTLTGISGQDIKFQNTDTYRYIEYDYDSSSDTSKRTSTTQQITSGLIVNLNGWVSGDDMITMTVNATISKQNSDSGNGNSKTLTTLPSTSERVVTTQVRTKSGEPVIISGLIKEDDSDTSSRTPHVSKIPLFGNLFKQSSKNKEKTEIVIYIVPHLIQEYSKEDSENLNLKRYYENFVGRKNGYSHNR